MTNSRRVHKRIVEYNPKGDLAQTAKFFLALCEINHGSTKDHVERVALLAEEVAKRLKKDAKASFFAGLLHDIGKLILPSNLFDGHNVDAQEYEHIKTHALAGFNALKKLHLFIALCAGLHHNLYQAGYGVGADMFPKDWSLATIKKVLEISAIISICDFVDAFLNRKTEIKDGSDAGIEKPDLKSMLYKKYPNDHATVDVVLSIAQGK
jgi:putative nucleotidyltransferase with HDIG domain